MSNLVNSLSSVRLTSCNYEVNPIIPSLLVAEYQPVFGGIGIYRNRFAAVYFLCQ